MSSNTVYWTNLDVIRIVHIQDADKIKITEIYRGNDGYWLIRPTMYNFESFEKYKKMYQYAFEDYQKVRDFIFYKAFAGIYTEMTLQFKLKNDLESLEALEKAFTI